ncbi:molybdate transport system permease protein [Pullulanibacillus pueri]|uniref:Molybdenum transport system permease n=1 Tax=Pullulanibacillus pueri TaxID=1437324 RepID=A0A8J3EM03_9BACL|nr:ABC transporter permease [Pullulanibacillus pueri]MBM7680952.1 molybdate transport system permease protein [Pullulanibacillus pueri]GGH81466.1 molybdenum ABC transporter permease [Pullulanibacillus pueri]
MKNFWTPFIRLILALGIAIMLGFLFVPLLSVFVSMTPGELFKKLNTQVSYQALYLSLGTTLIALAIIILCGTPVAYWLAKSHFWGNRFVRVLIQMPIVSPPAVAGVGLLLVFGRVGWLGSTLSFSGLSFSFNLQAVIMAQVFISAPFYISSAMQAFETIDDKFLAVSRTLGVSRWQTFWRVTIPLASGGLLTGAALSWGRALGEFGATMMFAGNLPGKTQTLPLAIYTAMQSDSKTAIAMSALLLFISFVLLLLVVLVGRMSHLRQDAKKKEGDSDAIISF